MKLKVWAFIKAVQEFVADGCQTVSREEYAARLLICQHCPSGKRDGLACSSERGGCGCNVHLKAAGRAWDCPSGHWPVIDRPDHSGQ